MITTRHVAAIAALICAASMLAGCSAVVSYDRMQEENDRQALIRDFRECIESHTEDPAMCDHITAGLNAAGMPVRDSGN